MRGEVVDDLGLDGFRRALHAFGVLEVDLDQPEVFRDVGERQRVVFDLRSACTSWPSASSRRARTAPTKPPAPVRRTRFTS